jgi:hypothetical protein
MVSSIFAELCEILKKISDPNYENELGDKYFLRVWCKL